MKDLIEQCKTELTRTRKMKKEAPEDEQKIFSGMIKDLQIAIEFMETGRPPGIVIGIYGQTSRIVCFDPAWLGRSKYADAFVNTRIDPYEEVENQIDSDRGGSASA